MVPPLGNAPSECKHKGFTVLPTSLMEYEGILAETARLELATDGLTVHCSTFDELSLHYIKLVFM